MESVYQLVELERVNPGAIPAIELHAKLAESFAQVALVSDPGPFLDQTLDRFRNFLHRLVWPTASQ
jgi:hypothetical protein